MRITVLQSGGHVGEVVLSGTDVNPLWIPSGPTIDPGKYLPERDSKRFGGGSAARLMSGLLGHNVCFPWWGDPSPAETAAGMTYHGETGIARWRQAAAGSDFMTVVANLPESGTTMSRTFRVKGQVIEVEAVAHNDKAWDRPVEWCEHVTVGPPFLERGVTEMEAPLTRGRVQDKQGEFTWPSGMAETKIDLRKVRALKQSPGFVNNFLVDSAREYGYVAAFHPGYQLVFGYVFPRKDFSWVNIWESNSPTMLTRGLEFSNTPVHGTARTLMKTPELWGTPTFDLLDAKGDLRKRFWIFSVRVPKDFKGIGNVNLSASVISVQERGAARTFTAAMQ